MYSKTIHWTRRLLSPPSSPLALHHSLTNFDYQFFIRYIPENTLKPCWFHVQINHAETALFDLDSQNTCDYHVIFISQHQDDSHLCDNTARWWPLWCEYKNDENNFSLYGTRILFGPKRKHNPSKYILWTDSVHLTDCSCCLNCPFNFDSHSDVIIAKQNIVLTH